MIRNLLVFAGLLLATSCTSESGYYRLDGRIMGTSYQITVGDNDVSKSEVESRALAAMTEVDRLMSTYKPDSEISRFNRHTGGDCFPISAPTLEVLLAAEKVHAQTGGAFDITVGPLVNLWGFGPDKRHGRPEADAISALLDTLGQQHLSIDAERSCIRKANARLAIDLSAIAKGYAVDRVAAQLDALGIENYLVEIGGEVKAAGQSPRQGPWRIAIESPVAESRGIQKVITPGEGGVATSGDYRNYFEEDGQRYSHTLDPRSGYPVNHHLASITIIHESVMLADAFATALDVMGPDGARAFARQYGLPVFLITKSENGFEEWISPEFENYLPGGDFSPGGDM